MVDPYDLNVIRGDSLRWTANFVDTTGVTYDLTGATLTMQVRNGYYPSALLASYQVSIKSNSTLSSPNGITGGISTTATGGIAYLCIGSTYTVNFAPYTNCFYDIQAVQPTNTNTITLARGRIQTFPDVTS